MCFWLGEGKPERKFSQTCHITEENMKKPKRKCHKKVYIGKVIQNLRRVNDRRKTIRNGEHL